MSDASVYGPSALATPANAVTVVRLLVSPILFSMIAHDGATWAVFALWVVLASTDGVDGWIARRHGTTRSGAFLDPLQCQQLRCPQPCGMGDLRGQSVSLVLGTHYQGDLFLGVGPRLLDDLLLRLHHRQACVRCEFVRHELHHHLERLPLLIERRLTDLLGPLLQVRDGQLLGHAAQSLRQARMLGLLPLGHSG